MYNIISDKIITSRRWGTKSAIEKVNGCIISESKTLVDKSVLNSEIDGMTMVDYMPSS